MALKLTKAKSFPIGVDLGTSAAKLVQLRQGDGDIELIGAASADVPRTYRSDVNARLDYLAGSMRNILKSGVFRGRECVLSLPAEATFVHHVRLAHLPAGEVACALEAELHGKLPYPVEDAVIRHIVAGDVLGDGEAKQEVIVVAASRATLRAYLDMARCAGLDVTAVNIECCAVAECFARLFRRATDAARTILFLDIGAATTQVVLTHGPKLVFARNLPTGGEQLDQAVASGLRVPVEQAYAMRRDLLQKGGGSAAEDELYHWLDKPLDALADELNQCLRYHESVFRNQTVERAIFVGGQAMDKRLCQSLAQRLNLPAQIGDPLVRVKCASAAGLDTGIDRRQPQPHWAVAVGLSVGARAA